ncbi:hypothetical protein [Nitrosovibrio sp. Nv17]|uniref:hypothetical protein n=1 Tax=Nitrosovibrio sp. Nv17 TaxID=1855339 RepID=UPI0009089F9E|nr:hypothetical protein [Nitrosovibrio sp. Nv17]SFW34893.1 hypothetical protein SAMN05216414_12158 [Nitrosovibrio sp. Nv17]
MSEEHEWCKNNAGKMKTLVENFYRHEPGREQRPPQLDASGLIRLEGEISSDLGTLRYITKPKSLLKELGGIVGNERSPDNAYFGPAPNLSLGDPGGISAAVGTFADLGSAVITIFKVARAENKMVKNLTSNAEARSAYKLQILRNYEQLVQLLRFVIECGAVSEKSAGILCKQGLNVQILGRCWKTVRNNQWLVLAG